MKQFIYPYLLLKNVGEAANYYKDVFNGEITYIMYGKDTPNCPEDKLEEIMHLQLKVYDHQIYMSEYDEAKPNEVIQLHLDFAHKDDLTAVFNRFKVNSKVIQELGDTHWGAHFGVLEDKYGVIWQLHYEIPQE